ncbi:MAG TPA: hypothetical protein VMX17_01005 [Candidatus Glassbacteria bacterium]|nr:hypothetical protein [Candidatus Glassbacteria bacterium]
MERTGTGTTKSLSKHIEEAQAKGYEVIVIGAGDMKHVDISAEAAGAGMAVLIERLSKLKNHIVIIEDIDKVLSAEQQAKNMKAFERPPIEIKMLSEPLPIFEARKKPYQEKHFAGFSKRRKK